jgi:YggT family protein
MLIVFLVLYIALVLFITTMFVRLILDFVVSFNRGWRPTGAGLAAAEIVYTITDPPIKLVRRIIPPLRLNGVTLDFGWSIVLLAAVILSYIVGAFLR